MDIKDIKAHYRAEREEIENQPWFIRIPSKIGQFLQYKVWTVIVNFPRELKWDIQRFFHGYADVDICNLNTFIILKIHKPLKEFVKNQAESGMSLPKEFATDPAAWLEILKKIEFSVDHAFRNECEIDYNPTHQMGIDEKDEFYKQVDEGFELFGKYLRDMFD